MVRLLERIVPDEADRRGERRAEIEEMIDGSVASTLMDVDATVADYCRARSLPLPNELEALVELHLRAIGAWLDTLDVQTDLGETPHQRRCDEIKTLDCLK